MKAERLQAPELQPSFNLECPAHARPDIGIDFSSSVQLPALASPEKKERLPGRPVVADSDYDMTVTAVMMMIYGYI